MISISQIRKLRHREVEYLAQVLKAGLCDFKASVFVHFFFFFKHRLPTASPLLM